MTHQAEETREANDQTRDEGKEPWHRLVCGEGVTGLGDEGEDDRQDEVAEGGTSDELVEDQAHHA